MSLPGDNCSEPLDPQAYRQHLLLLKSAHCARPVQYAGRNGYINGLTLNQAGGRLEMTVYLAGNPAPIDSSQIQITTTNNEGDGNGRDE